MPKIRPFVPATFKCQHCGVECERKSRRGQLPKWCGQRCADLGKKGVAGTCERCGKSYFGLGRQFCSTDCARAILPPKGPDLITPRAAEDWDELARLIRETVEVSPSGCWLWPHRLDTNGYPVVKRHGTALMVHRLAVEARHRAPLGTQAAHHACANPPCVRPDHVQPVTHYENVAEMLARQSYLRRIRELESALADAAPSHPLLAVVPVA